MTILQGDIRKILLPSILIAAVFGAIAISGRRSAAEAPAKSAAAAEQRVWLCDLPEKDVKVGKGTFGKNGKAGFVAATIRLCGVPSPHGLGMHPDSSVTYELGKKFHTFRAAAAMNDSSPAGCERPVMFQVLADGKAIWKSKEISEPNACQPCLLDVTGVDRLTLKTFWDPDREGTRGFAHSVWLEPYVSAEAPAPELLTIFAAKNFTQREELAGYVERTRALVADDKFAKLDEIAKEARTKHEFLLGEPKLSLFYAVIEQPQKEGEPGQLEHMDWLDRWQNKFPESPTPRIAAAHCWIELAFAARGGGYANTVTQEGFKLFAERIGKAADALAAADKLEIKDPELYLVLVRVGQYQNWPLEKIDEVVEKAVKVDPQYYPTYRRVVENLLPRWHGRPGDVRKFADGIRQRVGGVEGEIAYTQMAAEFTQWEGTAKEMQEFTYGRLKSAMLATIRASSYYDKSLIHEFCQFACRNNDAATAHGLFDLIPPGDCDFAVWQSGLLMESWRRRTDPAATPGEQVKTLQPRTYSPVFALAVAADGKHLYDAEGSYLGIWDLDAGVDDIYNLVPNREGVVQDIAINPAGDRILVSCWSFASRGPLLHFIDTSAPKPRLDPTQLAGHKSVVKESAFSRDGKHVATAGFDKTAMIWDLKNAAHPISIPHPNLVWSVAFSPDSKTLATGGAEGGIWLWDAETGKAQGDPLAKEAEGPKRAVVRFTPDGKKLVVVGNDAVIRVWDLATRKAIDGPPEGSKAHGSAISPDGRLLAVGRENSEIDLFELAQLKKIHTLHGHWAIVTALVFLPDGKTLVSGSADATLKFWDMSPYVKGSTALKASAAPAAKPHAAETK